jgi:hypothetical protein
MNQINHPIRHFKGGHRDPQFLDCLAAPVLKEDVFDATTARSGKFWAISPDDRLHNEEKQTAWLPLKRGTVSRAVSLAIAASQNGACMTSNYIIAIPSIENPSTETYAPTNSFFRLSACKTTLSNCTPGCVLQSINVKEIISQILRKFTGDGTSF